MSHTREPWKYQKGFLTIYSLSGGDIGISTAIAKVSSHQLEGNDSAEENARRIVACVNACAGVSTETLEKFGGRAITAEGQRDTYRDLCAELLDDLKSAQAMLKNNLGCESIVNKAIVKAESILGEKNGR